MKVSMINERRLGRFDVSWPMIQDREDDIAFILSGLIVVDAKREFDTDTLKYLAFGPQFDPVPKYEAAPRYMPRVTEHFDGDGGRSISVEWKRA